MTPEYREAEGRDEEAWTIKPLEWRWDEECREFVAETSVGNYTTNLRGDGLWSVRFYASNGSCTSLPRVEHDDDDQFARKPKRAAEEHHRKRLLESLDPSEALRTCRKERDDLKARFADYRDCMDLAGQIAESIEKADGSWCYEGDDLPGQILPHLQPLIGELDEVRKERDEAREALEDSGESHDELYGRCLALRSQLSQSKREVEWLRAALGEVEIECKAGVNRNGVLENPDESDRWYTVLKMVRFALLPSPPAAKEAP